jgi:hypothetical protein
MLYICTFYFRHETDTGFILQSMGKVPKLIKEEKKRVDTVVVLGSMTLPNRNELQKYDHMTIQNNQSNRLQCHSCNDDVDNTYPKEKPTLSKRYIPYIMKVDVQSGPLKSILG